MDIAYFVVNKCLRIKNEALMVAMQECAQVKAIYFGAPNNFERDCLYYLKEEFRALNISFYIVENFPTQPTYGYIKECTRRFLDYYIPQGKAWDIDWFSKNIEPVITDYDICPQVLVSIYTVDLPKPEKNYYEVIDRVYAEVEERVANEEQVTDLRLARYINHGLIDSKNFIAFIKPLGPSFKRYCQRDYCKFRAQDYAVPKNTYNMEHFEAWSTGATEFNRINLAMLVLKQTNYISHKLREILAIYWLDYCKGDWVEGEKYMGKFLLDYDEEISVFNWQKAYRWIKSKKYKALTKEQKLKQYTIVARVDWALERKWGYLIDMPRKPDVVLVR